MKISERGLKLIREHEGCRLKAYYDAVGVLTIGYGSTRDVAPGMAITIEEADARLVEDCADAENCINGAVTVPLTQPEFDALCSWVYNLGCGTFRKSSVLRYLNESNYDMACARMKLYDKAGGQVLSGLTRRRMDEAKLFESA